MTIHIEASKTLLSDSERCTFLLKFSPRISADGERSR